MDGPGGTMEVQEASSLENKCSLCDAKKCCNRFLDNQLSKHFVPGVCQSVAAHLAVGACGSYSAELELLHLHKYGTDGFPGQAVHIKSAVCSGRGLKRRRQAVVTTVGLVIKTQGSLWVSKSTRVCLCLKSREQFARRQSDFSFTSCSSTH